jgi:hypothetical protein
MKQSRFILIFTGFLVISLALAISLGRAAPPEKFRSYKKEATKYGDFLSVTLDSAPFPHAARNRGMQIDDAYYPLRPHYSSDQVKLFIPKGFLPKKVVDLVFFFHGWYSSADDAERAFDLTRQFAASGINALLILPETARYAPDSFAGKLEERGGFERFAKDLLEGLASKKYLRKALPGRIMLACHSGGYRAVAKVLEQGDLRGHVEEVYLFDALFGGHAMFYNWILAGRGRFVAVYSEEGDTLRNTDKFVASLRTASVPVEISEDAPGKAASALKSRITFLKSGNDHFGVISKTSQFQRLLASSGLGIPPMR